MKKLISYAGIEPYIIEKIDGETSYSECNYIWYSNDDVTVYATIESEDDDEVILYTTKTLEKLDPALELIGGDEVAINHIVIKHPLFFNSEITANEALLNKAQEITNMLYVIVGAINSDNTANLTFLYKKLDSTFKSFATVNNVPIGTKETS